MTTIVVCLTVPQNTSNAAGAAAAGPAPAAKPPAPIAAAITPAAIMFFKKQIGFSRGVSVSTTVLA